MKSVIFVFFVRKSCEKSQDKMIRTHRTMKFIHLFKPSFITIDISIVE